MENHEATHLVLEVTGARKLTVTLELSQRADPPTSTCGSMERFEVTTSQVCRKKMRGGWAMRIEDAAPTTAIDTVSEERPIDLSDARERRC